MVRRVIAAAVFVTVAAGVWWLLRTLDLVRVAGVLREAEVGWVVAAVGCGLAAQVSRALGWLFLLPVSIRFRRLVAYEFLAQGASAVSPEGASELVRVELLHREGVPRATTLTLMVVRKLFSSLGLVPLLLVLAWPADSLPPWATAVAYGYALVLGAVLGSVLVAMLLLSRPTKQTTRTRTPTRWLGHLHQVRDALAALRLKRALVALTGSSVLTRLLDLSALLLLARAIGVEVPPSVAVLVLVLIEVSNVLPTAPAQLGTFEAASLVVLVGPLGGEGAAALTILFHLQQILPQVVVGLLVTPVSILSGAAARRVPS